MIFHIRVIRPIYVIRDIALIRDIRSICVIRDNWEDLRDHAFGHQGGVEEVLGVR